MVTRRSATRWTTTVAVALLAPGPLSVVALVSIAAVLDRFVASA